MSFAPRHDYHFYDSAVEARRLEIDRATEASDRFDRYAEFFDFVLGAKRSDESLPPLSREKLDLQISNRRQMVAAFQRLDSWIRERRSSNSTD